MGKKTEMQPDYFVNVIHTKEYLYSRQNFFMAIILFDTEERKKLYPFSQTRAVADLRIGILTQRERWERLIQGEVYIYTEKYLQHLYKKIPAESNLWIDASFIYDEGVVEKILSLENNIALADENGLVAGRLMQVNTDTISFPDMSFFETIYNIETVKRLQYPWQIFLWNDKMIRKDFLLITKNRTSEEISSTNKIISIKNIFIEEGATVEYALLNAGSGPIYIDKNADVMEGCLIRGPFALCNNSVLKMGTKIYGATTVGPYCTGGGEIKNAVMQAYSNKAHDGYLGDSVIGQWCNIGAGTSNSNIKNTATEIKMYDHHTHTFMEAGNKCGLLMGDYTRIAINSSINTGSTIGICCNVFGEGLLPRFMNDFTWGTKMLTRYKFDKALRDISNWKKLKQQDLTDDEVAVLKYIFDQPTT